MFRQLLLAVAVVCLALEFPSIVVGPPTQRGGSNRQQSSQPPKSTGQSPRQTTGSQTGQKSGQQSGSTAGSRSSSTAGRQIIQSGGTRNSNQSTSNSRNSGLSNPQSTNRSGSVGNVGNRRSAVPPIQFNPNGQSSIRSAPNTNSGINPSGSTPVRPNTAAVVSPSPSTQPQGRTRTTGISNQKIALEAWGEELFQSTGLPDEARNMTVEQAVALGAKIAVQEHLGVPKDLTNAMTAEQITETVARLQRFGAWKQIESEEFWKQHNEKGMDSALGPHIRDNLGIPDGIHVDSPASKIMDDAGEIQNFGLDISNRNHWNLFGEYRSGTKTAQDLIDVANGAGQGNGRNTGNSGANTNGQPPANNRGSSGSGTSHPGNSSSDLPGAGANANPGAGNNSNSDRSSSPPGSRNQQNNESTGGAETADNLDGDSIETVESESYAAVVTHNDDGSFTVDVYRTDESGNTTKVESETYADADGDGTYTGNQGNTTSGKPAEGTKSAEKDEENGGYTFTENSDSSETDNSDGDTTADADADTSGDDTTTTKPDNKYTPGPDGGTFYDYNWMVSMYDRLSAEKNDKGKGGQDSTPNPMADSASGKDKIFNYKDTVVLPVDGTVSGSAKIPIGAIKAIQDPNQVQGGVIDPVKRKDR